jgi:ABC-type amino acid transport substrate-binding protein
MSKKISFYLCGLFLIFLSFSSCNKGTSKQGSRVGVDSSWYPLQLGPRENNVTAFSTELLAEIGRVEHIPFVKVNVNWNDLMEGLQKNKYEAILTSMPPYIFNEKMFNFSDIYLYLGPVLVVPCDSNIDSLDMVSNKEIAVVSGSSNDLILQKVPGVLIRYYDTIPQALNDILTQTVDGAVIDVLSAVAYCNDLYQGQLKIVTPPLTDEGLRLITKHGAHPALIKGFNQGLAKLKKEGVYQKILAKWGLQEPSPR